MKKTPAPREAGATEPRLYRVVSGKIEELIRAENIRPGERLPSERDLATKLGVSRTSLREALIALKLGGTVDVRGGSGVYVSERATPVAEVPAAGPGPFEVLAARRMIEVEMAALAAKHADRNFHLAIARATGNSAMVGVIEYLWSQRGTLWQRLKEHFQNEELRQQTLIDHRNIFAAIASHDQAAARTAMRAHLDRVTRTFSRG